MRLLSFRFRALLACLPLLLGPAAPLAPARAIDEVVINLPLLQTDFLLRMDELANPDTLWQGTSDLAQLNKATDGRLASQMVNLFNKPLPLGKPRLTEALLDNAMAEQVLMLLSSLIRVDGLPKGLTDQQLLTALQQASRQGPPTLRTFLEALPGQRARIRLDEALLSVRRLLRQQQEGQQLLTASGTAVTAADPAASPLLKRGPSAWRQVQVAVPAKHRQEPLQVVVLQPTSGANGQLVVISHGLWDSPENFEGWAEHLASHGYTVLMPRHPGSDHKQQQQMLAGQTPPPSPQELRARPLDVTASVDAVAAGRIQGLERVRTDQVTVIGHSWGATTALQLGGARPTDQLLLKRCQNLNDPARNLSWVLQCSFLASADQASLADPRVTTVIAVSPVVSLLFNPSRDVRNLTARTVIVSGGNDWVAPSGPEAIDPFRAHGNPMQHLVLVGKGDHFNLRRTAGQGGGPLRGLMLAWVSQGGLPAAGWKDGELELLDVTTQVLGTTAPPVSGGQLL
ncbi:MAG: alpha/beta hydrolase family protein [Cyanobacteriota bacterium]